MIEESFPELKKDSYFQTKRPSKFQVGEESKNYALIQTQDISEHET